MHESESESSIKLRRKRPERQLYVPPAQRTQRRLSKDNSLQENENDDVKTKILNKRKDSIGINIIQQNVTKKIDDNVNKVSYKKEIEVSSNQQNTKYTKIEQEISFIYISWKYRISKHISNFHQCQDFCEPASYLYFNYRSSFYNEIPIYSCNKSNSNILYILYKDYVLWQPKMDVKYIKSDENSANSRTYPPYSFDVILGYSDKKQKSEFEKSANCTFENRVGKNETKLTKSSVIALEEISSKALGGNETAVEKNNIKNSTTNLYITSNDLFKNMNIRSTKTSEHEQEKEIMRKTQKFVNRKTRPIMKYLDNASDTLQIGKNDNVNDWEDLFDDENKLEEKILKKIAHQSRTGESITKEEGEYSEYVSKQSEDLEHMVELYDFPPSLKTQDIIQAFHDVNSDAMYVKWVDDTHAILVLGSLKQAQRAVELDSSLIKVRPMVAASSMSLAIAYKTDLKPAMKRPQTNLQTARRLITTHLGKKSKISQEQNAKEKNDLKAARELKKLAKKNEQDAWEGNLRSSVN